MQPQPEEEKRPTDDPPPYSESAESSEALNKRNRGVARCYFLMMGAVYLALLITAVVALASFGIKEAEIDRMKSSLIVLSNSQTCLLFAQNMYVQEVDGSIVTNLSSPGLCGYVLWGFISITIVAFVWLVYSIVLAAIGPKIISLLRFIDLIMMALTALLSFSLSVTTTAGLNVTCGSGGSHGCAVLGYIPGDDLNDVQQLQYYNELNIAKSSSWATTVLSIVLSVWYFITVVGYCCMVSRRRVQARQYVHLEKDGQDLRSAV